jgi:hypothetical protein
MTGVNIAFLHFHSINLVVSKSNRPIFYFEINTYSSFLVYIKNYYGYTKCLLRVIKGIVLTEVRDNDVLL